MNHNASFGSTLCRLRKRQGFTQAALADQAGFNRNWISKLEQGKSSPTLDTLITLAEVLKLRVSELMVLFEGEHARGCHARASLDGRDIQKKNSRFRKEY